jgi:hypothetical protein
MNQQYEGNFTEHDISLLYEERVGCRHDMKVVRRYRTVNGYMAIVHLLDRYRIFFISCNFDNNEYEPPLRACPMYASLTEFGAIEKMEDIAHIVGAWEL